MAFWIIKGPDGEHLHQVRTKGDEEPWRDCPEGHSFVRVPRHNHDPRERFDEKTRRWKACPQRTAAHEQREREAAERAVASMPDAVLDMIAERVKTKIEGGG